MYSIESHQHSHSNHTPTGVMGGHKHKKGEWMFSYRFIKMKMNGNRSGTSNVSTADVLEKYAITPLRMDGDMHMFGVMYAVSDDLTFVFMLPYIEKSMNHINRVGVEFVTKSSGIGDTKFSAIYSILEMKQHNFLLNIGLSLPTGSIKNMDNTPLGNIRLPYPMQLGSGTVDPIFGFTYSGNILGLSYGFQSLSKLRFYDNSEDYRIGNEFNQTAWVRKPLGHSLSSSLRLNWKVMRNYKGTDDQIAQIIGDNTTLSVSTADPKSRGFSRLGIGLGFDYYFSKGFLKNHRVALEYLIPIYQDIDGVQLKNNSTLGLTWQKTL